MYETRGKQDSAQRKTWGFNLVSKMQCGLKSKIKAFISLSSKEKTVNQAQRK